MILTDINVAKTYFVMYLQSMTVTITSYMGYLRVGFGVEEGFIDEYQLKSCFEISLQMILEAAKNLPI